MRFSLRTLLFVIVVVAVWLGALFARSTLFVQLVSSATELLILVALPLAIWDSRPAHRAFWSGFFVVGVGYFLAGYCFNLHENLQIQVAELIVPPPPDPFSAPAPQPVDPFTLPPEPFYSVDQGRALYQSIPILFALIAATIGGTATCLITQRSDENRGSTSHPPTSPS
jgi:hypothetical protein